MLSHEARRLTGPNLLSRRPGAVLDVHLGSVEADAEAMIGAWRRQARLMLDVLGWRDEELAVRRFASGASLFASAPIDALYTATEVMDWAWEAAGAAAPDAGAFEAAAERLHHVALENTATFENYSEVASLYFHLAWRDNEPVVRSEFANPDVVKFH